MLEAKECIDAESSIGEIKMSLSGFICNCS